MSSGQTEPIKTNGNGDAGDEDDFLARERAALGEDADQFVTPGDQVKASAAAVEEGDDDLLGGGGDYVQGNDATEETKGFESSFPVIESQNEVCWLHCSLPMRFEVFVLLTEFLNIFVASRTRRYYHRYKHSIPTACLLQLPRA